MGVEKDPFGTPGRLGQIGLKKRCSMAGKPRARSFDTQAYIKCIRVHSWSPGMPSTFSRGGKARDTP